MNFFPHLIYCVKVEKITSNTQTVEEINYLKYNLNFIYENVRQLYKKSLNDKLDEIITRILDVYNITTT